MALSAIMLHKKGVQMPGKVFIIKVLNQRKIGTRKFGILSKFHIFRDVIFFTILQAKKNSAGPPADPNGLTRHQQGAFQV